MRDREKTHDEYEKREYKQLKSEVGEITIIEVNKIEVSN